MPNQDINGRAQSLGQDLLQSIHRELLRIRFFEERAAELLEAKEINCPCHLYIGQEAVAVGVCLALQKDDYILGNHRSHGHYLAKGGTMRSLMAELYCKATGCAKGRGGSMHLYNKEIGLLGTVPMVGATIPIAVGAALAAKLKRNGLVSVAFFGDGATEEGIFFEAVNFAALHKLPMIFVCENNYMSSHLALLDRRPTEKLHEIVSLKDLWSVRADGMNAIEMFEVSKEAVERARRGDGTTFIEAETYRYRGHVGPRDDLDVGIRDRDVLKAWIDRDPIQQIEKVMVDIGAMTNAQITQVHEQIKAEVEDSVEFARTSPDPDPTQVLEHVFIERGAR